MPPSAAERLCRKIDLVGAGVYHELDEEPTAKPLCGRIRAFSLSGIQDVMVSEAMSTKGRIHE